MVAALPDFEAYQRALAAEVGGFGGPKAQQWFGFTGRQKTAEIQILRDWRDVERYPDTCGDDALPLVASTFAMPQFYGESLVDWRARVVDAWDLHTLSGSAPTVEALLLAAGAAAVTITEAWQVPGVYDARAPVDRGEETRPAEGDGAPGRNRVA